MHIGDNPWTGFALPRAARTRTPRPQDKDLGLRDDALCGDRLPWRLLSHTEGHPVKNKSGVQQISDVRPRLCNLGLDGSLGLNKDDTAVWTHTSSLRPQAITKNLIREEQGPDAANTTQLPPIPCPSHSTKHREVLQRGNDRPIPMTIQHAQDRTPIHGTPDGCCVMAPALSPLSNSGS